MARSDGCVKIFFASCLFITMMLFSTGSHGWTGKVVGISDGDTITVMHDGREEKIRIYGVDCPEGHQDFGTRAKQFTASCVFGKTVEVIQVDTDRYGRTVAMVDLNGQTLGAMLVQSGMAWVYDRYCTRSECSAWRVLQTQARVGSMGLWSVSDPVPPWEFRRIKWEVAR